MDTSQLPALPAALQPYAGFAKSLLTAIAILVVGWLASKWAGNLTRRAFALRRIDQALGRFIASIAQYTVLAATVIASLGAVGIQTTSLIAVLASAGLAVGLALQGSLASFAAGVMILFFRPFVTGDKITAAGHTGVVSDIGLFATVLVTADNETIIIPNSAIASGSIVNSTKRGTLRGHVRIGVAYGSDIEQVTELLMRAAKRAELVLADPPPQVAFGGISARSLEFTVFAWARTDDYLAMLHNLRQAVYEELHAASISVPLSQVVVQAAA